MVVDANPPHHPDNIPGLTPTRPRVFSNSFTEPPPTFHPRGSLLPQSPSPTQALTLQPRDPRKHPTVAPESCTVYWVPRCHQIISPIGKSVFERVTRYPFFNRRTKSLAELSRFFGGKSPTTIYRNGNDPASATAPRCMKTVYATRLLVDADG